jgi:hypothetical protein
MSMPQPAGRSDLGPGISAGEPVNGFQILERVAGLPISTWRYHWEAPQVRHLGPMAQDWAATFGLGENNTTIAAVDANGVAMVSIQALYQLIGELRHELVTLQQQISALTNGSIGGYHDVDA